MSNVAFLDSQRIGTRAEARANVFVMAAIAGGETCQPVKIRNISPSGAMIEGACLPAVGERLQLRRGQAAMCATVVWRDQDRAGLRFDERIDIASWTPGGNPGQQRVDQVFHRAKTAVAGKPSLTPVAPAPEDPLAPSQLRRLACAIDQLADALADESTVVAQLASELQTLDIASQVLRKLADL